MGVRWKKERKKRRDRMPDARDEEVSQPQGR